MSDQRQAAVETCSSSLQCSQLAAALAVRYETPAECPDPSTQFAERKPATRDSGDSTKQIPLLP